MRNNWHFNTITVLFCSLLFSLVANASATDAETSLMQAVYKGKISGWKVELKRSLIRYPDGQYQLRSSAENLFASIEEKSLFELKEGRLVPQEYTYERSIFGKKSLEKIAYDWTKNQAFYTRSDRERNNTEHALSTYLMDPALYQIAIQADLAKGQDFLHYRYIKRKYIDEYQLHIQDNESIIIDDKKYDAKVVLRKDPDSDKSTKVWVVPKLHYMIAKIQHTDKDGDEFSITLANYSADTNQLEQFYQSFTNNLAAQPALKPAATSL